MESRLSGRDIGFGTRLPPRPTTTRRPSPVAYLMADGADPMRPWPATTRKKPLLREGMARFRCALARHHRRRWLDPTVRSLP